jgi:hypothetical protein
LQCTTGTIKNATVSWQKASGRVKSDKSRASPDRKSVEIRGTNSRIDPAKPGFPQNIKPKLSKLQTILK